MPPHGGLRTGGAGARTEGRLQERRPRSESHTVRRCTAARSTGEVVTRQVRGQARQRERCAWTRRQRLRAVHGGALGPGRKVASVPASGSALGRARGAYNCDALSMPQSRQPSTRPIAAGPLLPAAQLGRWATRGQQVRSNLAAQYVLTLRTLGVRPSRGLSPPPAASACLASCTCRDIPTPATIGSTAFRNTHSQPWGCRTPARPASLPDSPRPAH